MGGTGGIGAIGGNGGNGGFGRNGGGNGKGGSGGIGGAARQITSEESVGEDGPPGDDGSIPGAIGCALLAVGDLVCEQVFTALKCATAGACVEALPAACTNLATCSFTFSLCGDAGFGCATGVLAANNISLPDEVTCLGSDGIPTPECLLEEFLCKKVLASCDPNEIIGPIGYGEEQFVSVNQTLGYTVLFENDPDFATANAQRVTVRVPIDEELNPASFRLGDFGFGNFIYQPHFRRF